MQLLPPAGHLLCKQYNLVKRILTSKWGKNSRMRDETEAFISICFSSIAQVLKVNCLFCTNLLLWSILCRQGWDLGCVWWIELFCLCVTLDSVCVYNVILCVCRHITTVLFILCYYRECFVWSLQFIPMPVLYGVFLYMGVASLNGVQVSSCCSASVMLLFSQKKTLILLTYLISAGAWEPDRFQNMIWVQESRDKWGIVRIFMV